MYYITILYIIILLMLPKLSKKTKFLLALIPIFVIIWLRFGHGADYFAYEFSYGRLDATTFGHLLTSETRFELGYRIIQYPFLKYGVPFHIYFATLNSIILLVTSKWIYDNSEKPVMSLLLYYSMFFTVWTLSGARQGVVLAISLFMFMNVKNNLTWPKRLAIIFMLSLFHLSALFFIPLIYLLEYDWTKKQLLFIMLGSLSLTFLPLEIVMEKLTFLPGVTSVLKYIDGGIGFFDFPGLIRLMFFAFIFYHYDLITKSKHDKKIVNASLLGFSAYFVLKFSEVTASRLTVYTFVLVVIILPMIVEHYKDKKVLYKLAVIGTILFSLVFYQKELMTLKQQSGDVSEGQLLKMSYIMDKDYLRFDQNAVFHLTQEKLCEQQLMQYKKDKAKRPPISVEYNKDDTYFTQFVTVKDENGRGKDKTLYGVMNQDGNWLVEPELTRSPNIHENVMVNVEWNNIFTNRTYFDLSSQDMSREEMLEIVLRDRELEYKFYEKDEIKRDASYDDIPEEFRKFFPNPSNVAYFRKSEIQVPFKYYVLQVKYFDKQAYMYLDEHGEAIINYLSRTPDRFNSNGILSTRLYCSWATFDSDGNILWQE